MKAKWNIDRNDVIHLLVRRGKQSWLREVHKAVAKLSPCTRCGGKMFLNEDPDGGYEECLQCSCRRELGSVAVFGEDKVPEVSRGPYARRTI